MTQPQDPHAQLEQRKRQSITQLIFRTARMLNDLSIEHARVTLNLPKLRAAHTAVFPHIDHEGTRVTVIARRMGVSKQGVALLVDELVEMGALLRVPDPSDGRAKLIQFKQGGIDRGLDALGALDQCIAMLLGKRTNQALHESLLELHDELIDDPSSFLPPS